MPTSFYRYVWLTSRNDQIRIILVIAVVAPLAMVPLELQRRIVDHALVSHEAWLLLVLGTAYLVRILVQGGLNYVLNVTKGHVLEDVTRDLRCRILQRQGERDEASPDASFTSKADEGTTVSMLAAESEDIGGFASESLAVPLLQTATILWVLGYLVWVEPLIAGLAVLVYAPQMILVPRVQGIVNRLARKRISLVRQLGREAVHPEQTSDAELAGWQERTGGLVENIFQTGMMIYRHKYFLTFLGNFLDALGPLIVLIVGGYLVIHDRTDVSTLVVFISGFQRLADPWDQLINFYRTLSTAKVSFGLVVDALSNTNAAVTNPSRME